LGNLGGERADSRRAIS